MRKNIHIHIHRTTDTDQPRADNGQFGSGGGGAKPAAKKSTPAIAVKHANRGAGALAQLQASSNAHLKATGNGHLVTPAKNKPGTGGEKAAGTSKSHETEMKKKGEAHPDHLAHMRAASARKSQEQSEKWAAGGATPTGAGRVSVGLKSAAEHKADAARFAKEAEKHEAQIGSMTSAQRSEHEGGLQSAMRKRAAEEHAKFKQESGAHANPYEAKLAAKK